MNNSRNFTNDISNKSSFISLKNEINKKIKETLFDENSLFLSSSFNYFCSNYNIMDLEEEGKNISNIIENKSINNEEEFNESNSSENSEKKALSRGSESKKKSKSNESEEEKSSSFVSKFSKISNIEEKKQKYKIRKLDYNDIFYILDIDKNSKKLNDENNINTNKKEIIDFNKEKIELKINELENIIKNSNAEIKNSYLRKNVCLKLYKALNYGLKNYNLKEKDIKTICLYIENQGRIIDNSMTDKYKEFIDNIFKNISYEIKKDN